ncbi:hypothetical protein ACP43V_06175 [Vibrio genomosp. F10 str. 9ZC157]|uniref:Lipoprotein n=1 Tax=Vibrio genomosp. F10 str. ZF-129 TaxID=1187848 RepID=A0A1E5B9K3_9VIBR|nr:hypothetical protein [Vibrio genomosp. F10]OEE30595.1 hypothetical protein A1QO_14785 [Vibrio genomosp. F10 str. ZF-129]OEE96601.1 hypothetical protein A1QM_16370 [Vibrio genomosp. F10 str. 9ZC157]
MNTKTLSTCILCFAMFGCGSGSSSPDETPPNVPTTGDVVYKSLDLKEFKSLGRVKIDNEIASSKMSVGITFHDHVEPVNPDFGVIIDTMPEGDIQPPLECLNLPPVDILSIDAISDDWDLVALSAPTRFSDCEYVQTETLYFLKSGNELHAFPDGVIPQRGSALNQQPLMVVKAKSQYNDTESPILSVSIDGENGVYKLNLPTRDIPANIELLFPNSQPSWWKPHNFVRLEGNTLYINPEAYGNVLYMVDISNGEIKDSWSHSYIDTPFRYNGVLYMATTGDTHLELLTGGEFGDKLELPTDGNNFSNSYNVFDVVDNRFIIGDRCVVWDMSSQTTTRLQRSGGHDSKIVKDNHVYCVGVTYNDDSSSQYGGSSLELGATQVTHQVTLPSTQQIGDSLSLSAPFMTYWDKINNVFDDDFVTINLLTGEETVEVHHYQGEKVIDLIPLTE